MSKRTTGRYERTKVGGEEIAAFVPHALPPVAPPILIDAARGERIRAAEQALVRLELAGEMVPSVEGSSMRSSARRLCSRPRSRARRPRSLIC